MAKKGSEKNTVNKATHRKLMNQKKNKLRKSTESTKDRLKAIMKKANESKLDEGSK